MRAVRRRLADRGQSGQSLIEVVIAIVLLGGIFLSLVAALFAVERATFTNEQVLEVDTVLMTYGEILRDREGVAYASCTAVGTDEADNLAETYTDAVDDVTTDSGEPGSSADWRKPDDIEVEITDVRSWSSTAQAFVEGCVLPDYGVQRITYAVSIDDGPTREGTVVKRRIGPAS